MLTDRRKSSILIVIWLFILFASFFAAGGADDNDYIRFGLGPANDLQLLGLEIDSWAIWLAVVLFACVDTVINVWASEVIYPWITNTVYDDKQINLEYSKFVAMAITNSFFVYKDLREIVTVYLSFTQIDILLIRIFVEFLVTMYTTWRYIRPKRVILSVSSIVEMTDASYEPVHTEWTKNSKTMDENVNINIQNGSVIEVSDLDSIV